MNDAQLDLKLAKSDQVAELCNLINSAYRGDSGWTKETDIVAGDRISQEEIKNILQESDAHLLVYGDGVKILACICINKIDNSAHIGLFSVDPAIQGAGVGKRVLCLAEDYAVRVLKATKFVMTVVSQRPELISYYERRGYRKIGLIEPYPMHLNVGVPKIKGLTVESLEKLVT